ncbi:MAG TPA: sigma-70 family RNA polymerase sigma factor [Polyangia bacterium]|nr:sigma-70 family RNA polymerase sigma factor [Polyangia bacterium]
MAREVEVERRAPAVMAAPGAEEQAALVSRCISGEAGAWRALHGRYQPIVVAYLRRLGVRDAELEDACQDVFLQTFRYLPAFRGGAALPTWLYRLCVTQARKTRHRGRQAAAARELLERESEPRRAAAGAEMSDTWARQRVGAALEALTQGERLVFALFEIRGLAGKEIAEIAGCPVATVWRRLHDARQTFRAAIEENRN